MSERSHVTHLVALIALAIPVRCPREESFPSPHPAWHAQAPDATFAARAAVMGHEDSHIPPPLNVPLRRRNRLKDGVDEVYR